MIHLISRDPAQNQPLMDRVNAVLLHRHNGLDDFEYLDFNSILATYYNVFAAMIAVIGLVTGVSLLIGGVGIMNMVLVAISERTREIGLRKAVGASEDTIRTQFLFEAGMLSVFGGLLGTGLGIGLVIGISAVIRIFYADWVSLVSWPAVLVALVAATGTGVFFGWYPARVAAGLDPIVCLRRE